MTQLVTLDVIIGFIRESVQKKLVMSPAQWLDAAAKINVLKEDLDNRIAGLESDVADHYAGLQMDEGMSSAKARSIANAGPIARELRMLKAKQKRVEEYIRICKKRQEQPIWDQ